MTAWNASETLGKAYALVCFPLLDKTLWAKSTLEKKGLFCLYFIEGSQEQKEDIYLKGCCLLTYSGSCSANFLIQTQGMAPPTVDRVSYLLTTKKVSSR